MKTCTKCQTEKPEESYPYKNKVTGRRSTVCQECQKEYKKTHYHNNKLDHYRRNKEKKQRLRDMILEKKNQGCLLCDEICVPCLDFHHLDGSQKEFLISKMVNMGSSSKLQAELEKCVVLCANCHRKVHAGIIPEEILLQKAK